MTEMCPICEDSGLRLIIQPDGERYAQPCECRLQLQAARLLKRAAIPKRYEHCSLESFDSPLNGYRQADPSLATAHMIARSFVAGASAGMTMVASIPSSLAARATPWA